MEGQTLQARPADSEVHSAALSLRAQTTDLCPGMARLQVRTGADCCLGSTVSDAGRLPFPPWIQTSFMTHLSTLKPCYSIDSSTVPRPALSTNDQ